MAREGELLNGKYRLESLLGTGAMGSVYQAVNTSIGRAVAIKLLHPEVLGSQEIVERFVREGRAATMAVHPNIVQVLDFDRDEAGVPFIVQELLEGRDLGEHVQASGGRLPAREALDLLVQAADGLAAAHDKGLVHRDIKPANIFLADVAGGTVVKLVDFGISKLSLPDEKRTAAGTLMGTPLYMSPEQITRPLEVDARTDVWAIGVVLYELITGQSPFDGTTTGEIFNRIGHREPAPIEQLRPDCPRSVVDVVRVCLAKTPEARFADGRELGDGLRRAISHTKGKATGILGSTPPSGSIPMPWGDLAGTLEAPKTPKTPDAVARPPEPRAHVAKQEPAAHAEPRSSGRDLSGDDSLRAASGPALAIDEDAVRKVAQRKPARRRRPDYRPPPPDSPITPMDALLGTVFVAALAWAAPRSSLDALEQLLGHPPGLSPIEAIGGLFVLIVLAFVCWMITAAARERRSWALFAAALGSLTLFGTSTTTFVWFGFPRLPFPEGAADHLLVAARVGAVAVAVGLSTFGLLRLVETVRERQYLTAVVVLGGGLLGVAYALLSAAELVGVTLVPLL